MLPAFLPAAAQSLTEATSIEMIGRLQQQPIQTPLSDRAVTTAFVRQAPEPPTTASPVLLVHGFDSSLLEFRRLVPLLATQAETWAVDLLGFGFSDRGADLPLDPGAIKLHLHSFWQQQIARPVVLVGASMGGAAALDFALTYPECVAALVLLDSAGFAAGPAMGKLMVAPLDRWATAFLASPQVRRKISEQAYCDRAFATADAQLCASLHLQSPRWREALIAFTKSGGYNFLNAKIAQITSPTLIVWGRQDRILGVKDAVRFERAITGSQLVWIERCGHVPHLEKPQETAAAIAAFMRAQADLGWV